MLEYLRNPDPSHPDGRVTAHPRVADAVTFLRHAYTLVKPGGVLVVANMLDTHPQLGMTLNVVQWPWIHPRSVATMLTLLVSAGLDAPARVIEPNDGVYAVFCITKPDGTRNRHSSTARTHSAWKSSSSVIFGTFRVPASARFPFDARNATGGKSQILAARRNPW